MRAGGFHWVPGARGSNPHTAWPPRGVHVEFEHALRCEDISAAGGAATSGTAEPGWWLGGRMLVATVVVELYDETASFGRRLRLTHNCTQALYVFNLSVSLIGGARDRDITTHTDASVSTGRQIRDPYDSTVVLVGTGHLPCDPSASPQTPNFGPGLSDWRSGDPAYESFFVAETVHDVPYEQANSPGWSPANFTRGFRRYGLIGARMTRVLSPQCEQNPIKVCRLAERVMSMPHHDSSSWPAA
eukprot:COSAG01_NODE_3579_length_5913_cov_14.430513_5_plen_244_part_00